MPPRITQQSRRPRVSDRTMVDIAYNQKACLVFTIGRRRRYPNREPVRWKKKNPRRSSGAHQKQATVIASRGWKSRNSPSLSVEGRVFSLTFPFIEQALALKTPVLGEKAVFRHLRADQSLPKNLTLPKNPVSTVAGNRGKTPAQNSAGCLPTKSCFLDCLGQAPRA